MAVEQGVFHWLVCDGGCGRDQQDDDEQIYASTEDAWAAATGWTSRDGKVYCEDCADELGIEAPNQQVTEER